MREPLHPPHVTDEELLLDFYGESAPAESARVRQHLTECTECRTLDRELRAVLALVDSAPDAEAPAGFGREMWARVEPHVAGGPSRAWLWWLGARPWALAGGVAALVIGAFLVGRFTGTGGPVSLEQASTTSEIRERLLRAEVGEHLERSQRVLVEFVNADLSESASMSGEQARAADLVAYGRLYRRSAQDTGDTALTNLLDELERVLLEVANGSPDATSGDLADLRARIDEQDLVFRLRVVAAEMRERDRRGQAIW